MVRVFPKGSGIHFDEGSPFGQILLEAMRLVDSFVAFH
jgi:hypothetical protein